MSNETNIKGSKQLGRLGGGKRKNRDERKELRRIQAEARQELREERSDEDQLEILVARGYANCKEALTLRG